MTNISTYLYFVFLLLIGYLNNIALPDIIALCHLKRVSEIRYQNYKIPNNILYRIFSNAIGVPFFYLIITIFIAHYNYNILDISGLFLFFIIFIISLSPFYIVSFLIKSDHIENFETIIRGGIAPGESGMATRHYYIKFKNDTFDENIIKRFKFIVNTIMVFTILIIAIFITYRI